eukprot:scaffold687140_cov83-Attheya_sp.AAC.2
MPLVICIALYDLVDVMPWNCTESLEMKKYNPPFTTHESNVLPTRSHFTHNSITRCNLDSGGELKLRFKNHIRTNNDRYFLMHFNTISERVPVRVTFQQAWVTGTTGAGESIGHMQTSA